VLVYTAASSSSRLVEQRFLTSPFLSDFRLVFRRDGVYVFRREPPP
jgi:hypothetical protein